MSPKYMNHGLSSRKLRRYRNTINNGYAHNKVLGTTPSPIDESEKRLYLEKLDATEI